MVNTVAACVAAYRLLGLGSATREFDRHRCDEIEIAKLSAGSLGSLAQRAEEGLREFGDERISEPSVGHLSGEPQVGGPHGRDVNRDMRRFHERSQRAPLALWQRERVDLARMDKALAPAHRPDDLDRLAGRLYRPGETDPVPALHHSRSRHAHPEPEATCGERLQAQCRGREQRRTARPKLDDEGAEPDRGCL